MKPIIKGLIVSLSALIVISALWIAYGERISRKDALPDSYALLAQFEKEGVPDFEANEILPGKVLNIRRFSEFKGKTIILSFWASWCGPCVEEFPSLMKMADHFNGDILVVGVSADQKIEDITGFMKVIGASSRHFVNLWDPSTQIAASYGTDKIPENYIITKDFKLARKLSNSIDWMSEDVLAYLESLK